MKNSSNRKGTVCRTGRAALCFFLAAVFLTAHFAVPASAEKKIDPSGRGAGYSAVLYDNSNGLPTSEANDIAQSDDGFIWIGGYSGLIRYDGNEFYRYSSSGLSSVVCLHYDTRQRLWIGTNDSGIAVLERGEFSFYGRAEGLRSLSIRSITEDADGNIVIATTLGLAYVDPDGALHAIDDTRINTEYVCELYTGTDGAIYGVTLDGDFFTIESTRLTHFFNCPDTGLGTINTIYPDPDHPGFVYLGSIESHLYYGDLRNGLKDPEVLSAAPLETINAIRLFDGVLWVASDSGVGIFDKDRTFILLTDLPMTNSIDHIMQDYEGNLWFSSSRQGVMKIVENRFVDLSALAGLEPLVVNSTCLWGGDLYVGTDTGLRILDENYAFRQNRMTEMLEGVRIRCIKRDADDKLWFCTYSNYGLVQFDPKTNEVRSFTEDNGMLSNRVRMIKQLADGAIAAATNNGLCIIRNGVVTETYGSNVGITNLEILTVEEGADGRLYLGSDGGGIYVIDGAQVSRLSTEDGLKSEVILRLKKDPLEELFWIITSNSISYLKDGTITTLQTFPYANNFDLFFDKNERVWILSSNGVYVTSRADLLSDKVDEFTLFDKDYGLPGIATANSYSCLTEDGELYVSATTGIYRVNINGETGGGSEIKLSVPFITADDEYYWVRDGEEIHIPSDCKRLNVYANAFTYSLCDPHLSYRLEGFDREDHFLTKQDMTYASYTNLGGGTYRFVLSMIDDVTGKTVKTVTQTIIKDKAIYEHVWFIVAVILLGIALIFGLVLLYFRRKTAALIRKQEETREMVNEMIKVFSGCIDMKDAYTNGHSARVAKYTAMMAERMGKTPEEVHEIYNIALLHDIGKIGIPDSILNKPGKLDDDEFAVMKSHAQSGYDILRQIKIDQNLAQGAGFHHEKYNGTGYPSGLKGDDIPEIARIIAVADAFDAMYSTRPYRKKMPLDAVAAEIERCSGTQFSPDVVKVFLQLVAEGRFTDETIA